MESWHDVGRVQRWWLLRRYCMGPPSRDLTARRNLLAQAILRLHMPRLAASVPTKHRFSADETPLPGSRCRCFPDISRPQTVYRMLAGRQTVAVSNQLTFPGELSKRQCLAPASLPLTKIDTSAHGKTSNATSQSLQAARTLMATGSMLGAVLHAVD
jgi:hypothetical protein